MKKMRVILEHLYLIAAQATGPGDADLTEDQWAFVQSEDDRHGRTGAQRSRLHPSLNADQPVAPAVQPPGDGNDIQPPTENPQPPAGQPENPEPVTPPVPANLVEPARAALGSGQGTTRRARGHNRR